MKLISFPKINIIGCIFIIILITQVLFWNVSKEYKPNLSIVPDVPSKLSVKAFAFGDEEFYFRLLAYRLQNAGDSFGRFTALKDYNYKKLYNWFSLLDTLDHKSNYVPSMASYYYSQTQRTADVRYIINYLDEHSEHDLSHKWWWMSQAVYLAGHKLKNQDLALKLAYKLSKTPLNNVPLWVKQMPALIHEQRGEMNEALYIIQNIIDNADNISEGELNFMHYFIKERLKKLPK